MKSSGLLLKRENTTSTYAGLPPLPSYSATGWRDRCWADLCVSQVEVDWLWFHHCQHIRVRPQILLRDGFHLFQGHRLKLCVLAVCVVEPEAVKFVECGGGGEATEFLARNLSLQTVGEGVETPQQRDFLRDAGCNLLQGYLFSRALPANECLDLVQRHHALI